MGVFLIVGCATSSTYTFNQQTNLPNSENNKIIFLSDTQSPIWIETFFLDENNNEFARSKIFEQIISKEPTAVVHLGDLVALGLFNSDWDSIDTFVNSLRNRDINFYPILGNHELIFCAASGEENFFSRFPFASKTGYSVIINSLAVLLLNSNFSDLTENEILKQQKWYKNELTKMENDSTISSIIVGCHHPPFTNSTVVDADEEVLKMFVPLFISNRKCKIFLSGHSHAFEHFKYKKKEFFVIGGGGGLQHPLSIGDEAKLKDFYNSDSEIRNFHFIELTSENDSLVFKVKMLDEKFETFNVEYEIKL